MLVPGRFILLGGSMKAAFIVVTSVLGTLWVLSRFVPVLLMSIPAFWLVIGFTVLGLVVARACKG
jgi:hypothetical protein